MSVESICDHRFMLAGELASKGTNIVINDRMAVIRGRPGGCRAPR